DARNFWSPWAHVKDAANADPPAVAPPSGPKDTPKHTPKDARPESALVDTPTGPVTHGLAAARDKVLDAARRQGKGRFDVIADGGCGKTRLLQELAEGLRDL